MKYSSSAPNARRIARASPMTRTGAKTSTHPLAVSSIDVTGTWSGTGVDTIFTSIGTIGTIGRNRRAFTDDVFAPIACPIA